MALIALKGHIDRLKAPREAREQLNAFAVDARREIDRRLKDEVRKAFVPALAEHARQLLENYLTNVEAYCRGTSTEDPVTGEDREPDENLVRAIEQQVRSAVPESAKDTFRQGVLMRIGIALRRSERPLTYAEHEDGLDGSVFAQAASCDRRSRSSRQGGRRGCGVMTSSYTLADLRHMDERCREIAAAEFGFECTSGGLAAYGAEVVDSTLPRAASVTRGGWNHRRDGPHRGA